MSESFAQSKPIVYGATIPIVLQGFGALMPLPKPMAYAIGFFIWTLIYFLVPPRSQEPFVKPLLRCIAGAIFLYIVATWLKL